MSTKELKELILQIKEEFQTRIKEEKEVLAIADELLDEDKDCYKFQFESKYSKNKKPHYVALIYGKDRINRKFFDLYKFEDNEETIVIGEIKVKEGKVFEIQNSDGRNFYLVDNLQPVKLGNSNVAKVQAAVFSYIRGDISKQQLYELLGLKEININVPGELQDD